MIQIFWELVKYLKLILRIKKNKEENRIKNKLERIRKKQKEQLYLLSF